jgi:uncharacterized protein YodC (DUF2158 family)
MNSLKMSGSMQTDPSKIVPGDVVTLKSGSPKYVVYYVVGKYAACIWSDYHSQLIKKERFPLVALRKQL